MVLSKEILNLLDQRLVQIPAPHLLDLPEKVLQFGTGVLLRGLPDYFIDKANKAGKFNGRMVLVKSTEGGESAAFDKQDCLYTQCVRGVENGSEFSENIINASVSRVLSARSQWNEILQCASNPELTIIISNTTEVGIQLVKERIDQSPPSSFPAKLLAFLFERFKKLGGMAGSGMVVIPTELIADNGSRLKAIVLELAAYNELPASFVKWLETENQFCSSLVDRIVPGKPAPPRKKELENLLGYEDELLIVAEWYRLWAIEGNEETGKILSFASADPGVIIEPDITRYRELKLRLLNGTHTAACGLAFLSGIRTVREAMEISWMHSYIGRVMMDDIAGAIPYPVPASDAINFGRQVLDRFSNPAIEHAWINITVQFTSKIRMRLLPVLKEYVFKNSRVPPYITLGLAGWLLFMKAEKQENEKFYGRLNGEWYPIQDEAAGKLYQFWKQEDPLNRIEELLADFGIWGENLNLYEGLKEGIRDKLKQMLDIGVAKTIQLSEIIKADA